MAGLAQGLHPRTPPIAQNSGENRPARFGSLSTPGASVTILPLKQKPVPERAGTGFALRV